MGENTLPMACTDPAYVDEPTRRIVRDFARGTVVRANVFRDVTYGVRVEDDRTVVEANTFDASSPDRHAVVIGTPDRTTVLGEPVDGTVLRANQADIAGNDSPYRWVHGQSHTKVEGNTALGEPTGMCKGVPLPRQPFIFAIAVAPALPDGSEPPTPDLTVATVGALPSCRTATTQPPGRGPAGSGSAPPATATATAAQPIDTAARYAG